MRITGPRPRIAALSAVVALALTLLGQPSAAAAVEADGYITGRVTGPDGQPLGPTSGICALVGGSSGSFSNLEQDGTFQLTAAPGKHFVRFTYCADPAQGAPRTYATEYYPNRHDPEPVGTTALPNVTVTSGATTTGIDAQLEVGGRIDLRITDTSAAPRAGICVEARGRRSPSQAVGVTGADGTVSLGALGPDAHVVEAKACGDSGRADRDLTRIQFWGGVFDEASATPVMVALGQTVDLTMPMAPGAVVAGQVSTGGRPVEGSCVAWGAPNDPHMSLRAMTDAEGRYQLNGITPTIEGKLQACPGTTTPRTQNAELQLAASWYSGAASRSTATPVRLQPGSTTVWNPELQRLSTLSAIVTNMPSASGCQFRVVDPVRGVITSPLRASPAAGTWFSDITGLTGRADSITLQCGGKALGRVGPADYRTPFFEESTGEDSPPVVHISVDEQGPTITANGAPTAWTNTPARVTFTCTDTSGVSSCPAPLTFSEGQVRTVLATDPYGNTTQQTFGPFKIDQTPPRLYISTTRRTFHKDEVVHLGCRISDTRSGLKLQSNTCPPVPTKASALGVGEHRFHMLAVDHAGNSAGMAVDITIVK